jgi:hypothetical protein
MRWRIHLQRATKAVFHQNMSLADLKSGRKPKRHSALLVAADRVSYQLANAPDGSKGVKGVQIGR